MKRNKLIKLIIVFLAIGALVVFISTPVFSEDQVSRTQNATVYSPDSDDVVKDFEPEWGTAAVTSWPVFMDGFVGLNATFDNLISFTSNRKYCTGNCTLEAPVQLPQGVKIYSFEFDYYDSGASSGNLTLLRCPYNGGNCQILGSTLYSSGNSGYGSATRYVTHTINNWANYYVLELMLPGTSTYGIVGALVRYQLQVSSAPGGATFWDVPTTHPFFRYVEALARSGITSGCGGGAYCINDPVTRGQMAVFLSKALGLHWPN